MSGENLTVAKRYATALFELCREKGIVEEVDKQAMQLHSGVAREAVASMLHHPEVPQKAKQEAVEGLLDEELYPPLRELIKLMLGRNRAASIQATLDYYDLLTDRYRGVEDVKVITAVELDDNQRQNILDALDHFSDYDFRSEFEVDPSILGGVIVELGRNQIIDGSLRGKLKEMRETLELQQTAR